MTLQDKITRLDTELQLLFQTRTAALLCSFGKDSMVLCHAITRLQLAIPIVTFVEEFLPEKWRFARKMALDWSLEIYYPPPMKTWIYEREGKFVLGSSYDIGGGMDIAIPKDVIENDHDDPMPHCGMTYLGRPTGAFHWPWQVAIIGHKDVDTDPVCGGVPLKTDRVPPVAPGMAEAWFPLKDWTDADVWEYHAYYGVPFDRMRYDVHTEALPRNVPNASNTDYLTCCVACLKSSNHGQPVHCPIKGGLIPSMADAVPRMPTLQRDYFTAENPTA